MLNISQPKVLPKIVQTIRHNHNNTNIQNETEKSRTTQSNDIWHARIHLLITHIFETVLCIDERRQTVTSRYYTHIDGQILIRKANGHLTL